MIEVVGYWGSFCVGLASIFLNSLGVYTFWRRYRRETYNASRRLSLAIMLGFAVSGGNTLFWQVYGQFAIAVGWTDVPTLRLVGSYLDTLIFKLIPPIVVLMHLEALHLALPEDERRRWSVLGMAFYPRADGFFARALNGFCRRSE